MEKKRSKAAKRAANPRFLKALLAGDADRAAKDAKPLALAEFFGGIGGAGVALAPTFQTKFINEFNEYKAALARLNLGHEVDIRSIAEVRSSDLPETLDLVWASFPCQDFSALGRGQGFAGGTRGVALFELFRILRERRDAGLPLPPVALENVERFVSFNEGADFGMVISAFAEFDYEAAAFMMEGGDFIPVLRKRVFIVAWPRGTVLPPGLVAEKADPRWTTEPLALTVSRLPPEARAAWRWLTMPAPPPVKARVEEFLDEDGEHEWYPEKRVAERLATFHAGDVEALRRRAGDGTAWVLVDAQRSKCRDGGERRYRMHEDGVAHCLTAGNARQRWLRCTAGVFSMRDISAIELTRMSGLPPWFRLHGNTGELWTAAGEGLSIPCVAWLGQHVLAPVAEAVRAHREAAEERARKAAEPPPPPAPPFRAHRVVGADDHGVKKMSAPQTVYLSRADSERLSRLAAAWGMSKHDLLCGLLDVGLELYGQAPLTPVQGGRRDRPPVAKKPLPPRPVPEAVLNLAREMAEKMVRERLAANDDEPEGKTRGFFGGGAAHSSNHGEWWTPGWLLGDLMPPLGLKRFTRDLFSPGAALSHVPADVHYTKEDDAMADGRDWSGDVFANPPYDKQLKNYVRRCRMAAATGEARLVVGVLPARTETVWWGENVVGHADVLFLRKRVAFVDGTGVSDGNSPGHATALVLWGATAEQVAAVRAAFPDAGFMPKHQGLGLAA